MYAEMNANLKYNPTNAELRKELSRNYGATIAKNPTFTVKRGRHEETFATYAEASAEMHKNGGCLSYAIQ